MGLEERRFRRVQINKRDSWRTSFSEAEPYTHRARASAGLQRLLDDAGYDLREGRAASIRAASRRPSRNSAPTARLAPTASEDQLIDALETAARRRAQTGRAHALQSHPRPHLDRDRAAARRRLGKPRLVAA